MKHYSFILYFFCLLMTLSTFSFVCWSPRYHLLFFFFYLIAFFLLPWEAFTCSSPLCIICGECILLLQDYIFTILSAFWLIDVLNFNIVKTTRHFSLWLTFQVLFKKFLSIKVIGKCFFRFLPELYYVVVHM